MEGYNSGTDDQEPSLYLLQQVFQLTSEAIRVVGVDCKILYVNDAYVKLSGKSRAKLVGYHCSVGLNSGRCNSADCPLQKIFDDRETLEGEVSWENEGVVSHLYYVVRAYYNPEGDFSGIIESFRDITIAQTNEKRFRALFENNPDPVLMIEKGSGKILDSNFLASVKYGYTHDEMRMLNILDLSAEPEETVDVINDPLRFKFVNRRIHRTKEGKLLYFEITTTLSHVDGKEVIIANYRDITERLKAEQQAYETGQNYTQLFNHLPVAFALHDVEYDNDEPVDYKYLSVNPAYERMVGKKEDELKGQSVFKVMPETEDYWIRIYGEVARTGEPLTFEDYSSSLDRYFEITVYSPRKGRFATIISDVTHRINVENALRESQTRYKELFDNLRSGVLVLNVDDHGEFWVKDINLTGARMEGLDKQQLTGCPLKNVFPGVHGANLMKVLEKVRKTAIAHYIPETSYKVKGSARWREYYIYKLPTNEIIAVFDDITARVMAEQSLKDSEHKYRMLYENAPLAYQSLDSNAMVLDANPKWLKEMGYERDEVIGHWFGDFLERRSREEFKRKFPDFIDQGELTGVQLIMIKKGGKLVLAQFEGKLGPAREEGGVKMYCVFKDITEQEAAKQALYESEERYRAVTESAPIGIIVIQEGRFFYMNPSAKAILCVYELEDCLVQAKNNLFQDDLQWIFDPDWPVNNREQTLPIESWITRADGDKIPVQLIALPVFIQQKPAALLLISDISDRKEAERRVLNAILETEERERKRFAEDLHDELGPFLSGIKLYLNELAPDHLSSQERIKLIGFLKEMTDEAVNKTKSISNQLMPNVLQDFGLFRAINSFAAKIQATGTLSFDLLFPDEALPLSNNQQMVLYRVLIELINNTIKHAMADMIRIEGKIEGSKLVIIYEDDGKGFDLKTMLDKKAGHGVNNVVNRIRSIDASYDFKRKKQGIQFIFEINLHDD